MILEIIFLLFLIIILFAIKSLESRINDSEEYLVENIKVGGSNEYSFRYTQDKDAKWNFYTNKEGNEQLKKLNKIANEIIKLYKVSKEQKIEGEKIYKNKPNMKKSQKGTKKRNATWSQDEYSHLGFITEYVKYKSVQRFTEMYTALERLKSFNHPFTWKNVISIGGGPGFELYALREFMSNVSQGGFVSNLISIDLNPNWKLACDYQDIDYQVRDVVSQPLKDYSNTLFILSYVYYTYLDVEYLNKLLTENTDADVIILDRSPNMDFSGLKFKYIELCGDSRQIFIGTRVLDKLKADSSNSELSRYPNVPYELVEKNQG